MLKIGLTGGIGTGKSTVREMLGEKGARVFDADAVAKRLMEEDPAVRQGLEPILGVHAWDSDGRLNRPWIAKRIFGDDDVRKAVNGVVHPAVHAAFDRAAEEAAEQGAPAIVREAALLPGPEQRRQLDILITVTAPRAARLQRVLDRDQMTVPQIEERMRAQPEESQYATLADDVIRNTGSLEDLREEVDRIWNRWLAS